MADANTAQRAKKNHKSIAKAWPYLSDHASHIDGEVANANDDQLRIVEQLTDALAAAQREVEDLQEKLQAERHGNSYIRRALGIKKSEVLLVGVNRIAGEIAAAQRENAKLRAALRNIRDLYDDAQPIGEILTRLYDASSIANAALRGEGEGC